MRNSSQNLSNTVLVSGRPLVKSTRSVLRNRAKKARPLVGLLIMGIPWDNFKDQIHLLYMIQDRPLKEVRVELLTHGLDASIRAYKNKVDEWGFHKNRCKSKHNQDRRLQKLQNRTKRVSNLTSMDGPSGSEQSMPPSGSAGKMPILSTNNLNGIDTAMEDERRLKLIRVKHARCKQIEAEIASLLSSTSYHSPPSTLEKEGEEAHFDFLASKSQGSIVPPTQHPLPSASTAKADDARIKALWLKFNIPSGPTSIFELDHLISGISGISDKNAIFEILLSKWQPGGEYLRHFEGWMRKWYGWDRDEWRCHGTSVITVFKMIQFCLPVFDQITLTKLLLNKMWKTKLNSPEKLAHPWGKCNAKYNQCWVTVWIDTCEAESWASAQNILVSNNTLLAQINGPIFPDCSLAVAASWYTWKHLIKIEEDIDKAVGSSLWLHRSTITKIQEACDEISSIFEFFHDRAVKPSWGFILDFILNISHSMEICLEKSIPHEEDESNLSGECQDLLEMALRDAQAGGQGGAAIELKFCIEEKLELIKENKRLREENSHLKMAASK